MARNPGRSLDFFAVPGGFGSIFMWGVFQLYCCASAGCHDVRGLQNLRCHLRGKSGPAAALPDDFAVEHILFALESTTTTRRPGLSDEGFVNLHMSRTRTPFRSAGAASPGKTRNSRSGHDRATNDLSIEREITREGGRARHERHVHGSAWPKLKGHFLSPSIRVSVTRDAIHTRQSLP